MKEKMKEKMKYTTYKVCLTLLLLFSVLPAAYTQGVKKLTILQTSDTHSRIDPMEDKKGETYAGMGGAARRVNLVAELRKENPDLLLFDCGDFSQGTPYYNFYQGEAEMKVMNYLHYDALAIGNHEFDFGLENMAKLYRMATFPVICSNYGFKDTPLEGLVKPFIIIRRDGIKIGLFALGAPLAGLVSADKYENVTYREPIVVANEMAAKLKKKEKCDLVICLSHLGVYEDKKLIPQTRHIDLILGGHSHTVMEQTEFFPNMDGKQVPLFHIGKNGIFVGQTDLVLKK